MCSPSTLRPPQTNLSHVMYKRDLALLKSTYGALRLCRPTNDSPCTAQLKKKRPFCWIMTCEKANAGDQQPALQRRNLRDLAQHFTKIRPGLDQVDGVHLMDVVPLHVIFSKRKKFVKRRPGVSAKKKKFGKMVLPAFYHLPRFSLRRLFQQCQHITASHVFQQLSFF